MTQKLWQKKPKLNYKDDVLDIVQFGSSVKENELESKPNDIDIAVIFRKIPIKEQLDQAQEIKNQIQKLTDLPIHVKSFDLYNLFDKSNFAKESILFYGKSIINGDYFAKNLGLNPKIHLSYNLSNLKKKDKVRFNYLLNGKKGNYGLLRKYKGELISPGIIEIPSEYEDIFLESMKKITENIKIKRILY